MSVGIIGRQLDHLPQRVYGIVGLPITSNNYTGRIDHDFSDKWRFMASYRDYKLIKLGTQQVPGAGHTPAPTLLAFVGRGTRLVYGLSSGGPSAPGARLYILPLELTEQQRQSLGAPRGAS